MNGSEGGTGRNIMSLDWYGLALYWAGFFMGRWYQTRQQRRKENA